MDRTIFLFSGEGTQGVESRYDLLKRSPSWGTMEKILHSRLNLDLERVWKSHIGSHRCPFSPLLTAVAQIALADLWRRWGYRPDAVVGHSTGELAAAYLAGFYELEEILTLALHIGETASRLEGAMLHGWLTDEEIGRLRVAIASSNFREPGRRHVTLSGDDTEMTRFALEHPGFVKMRIPHPWHHPDYEPHLESLPRQRSGQSGAVRFLSGVTSRFETQLPDDYWRRWMVRPVDFIETMEALKAHYDDDRLQIIEVGFHPVWEKHSTLFNQAVHVSSMFRGEEEISWILFQRSKLRSDPWVEQLKMAVEAYRPGLDFDRPLSHQGFHSLEFTELSRLLQPFFPSLAPQDFYRYKTLRQLIERFGLSGSMQPAAGPGLRRNAVAIAGMSCRFPADVQTVPQFWDMLTRRTDPVGRRTGRGEAQAGFLDDAVSRFDHRYFGISQAEAATMDPQQILALELAEMLWRDAGIDPQKLDRRRVGVYIGAWNQEYGGDKNSVYYPTGTNPSIIAARISQYYDLRGPSWVSNTACSSSFVAIHYAAKDIEAGRIDYAIAGGVNMLLDEAYTERMRRSGFLSPSGRCKTFDDAADGYVRAEGGGLVLLVNASLAETCYAELIGSAVNHNGSRAQVMTAPHPEAQEELIAAACQDAGIAPQQIAYVECHGTGTKLGDPIELSAIQNTIAAGRKDVCYVGSVKSNIGHLESAAGIAGLIKAAAVLNHGIIPPNLHFHRPNAPVEFQSRPIRVVTEPTPIDRQACIGISSFGFGGANAHVVIRGVGDVRRKPIRPPQIPFDRQRAAPLSVYLKHQAEEVPAVPEPAAPAVAENGSDLRGLILDLIGRVAGVETIDPQIPLFDQGLDSMSATEMLHALEEEYAIEIEPDILFDFPMLDQFAEEIGRRAAARNSGAVPGSGASAQADVAARGRSHSEAGVKGGIENERV